MIRILFVCLGNICRSPMAEFVFRELERREGLEDRITAESADISAEALGCNVHAGARQKLQEEGIPFAWRQARQIERRDYARFDHLIGMETRNVSAMRRAFGGDPEGKICRLLDYTQRPRDIADPWYTDDFDAAYRDILEGCGALLEALRREL